jgi:hypothetical protein
MEAVPFLNAKILNTQAVMLELERLDLLEPEL